MSTSAQVSKTEVAVSGFRKSHQRFKWDSKSVTVADVTCDGKPDTVILGFEKNNVVVAVLAGAHANKTPGFSFPGAGIG